MSADGVEPRHAVYHRQAVRSVTKDWFHREDEIRGGFLIGDQRRRYINAFCNVLGGAIRMLI